MKVAIYARVSTDDKDQNPDRQKMKCEQYCELHNHEVLVYAEDYGTGDSSPFDREGFKEIWAYDVQAVVVYEISRFSREHPSKVMRRLQELKDKGIKIVSITEPAFNMEGEMSDLLQYIMTWFNNYYLTSLKRNVKSGIERARKQGKQIGRAKVNFNERRAYHLLFEEGMSQRAVSKELDVSLSTINRFKKVSEKTPPSFIKESTCFQTGVFETQESDKNGRRTKE